LTVTCWCRRTSNVLYRDVLPRCVSCVKSATRCREPHSRCRCLLWSTRDWTMEIACGTGRPASLSVTSAPVSHECSCPSNVSSESLRPHHRCTYQSSLVAGPRTDTVKTAVLTHKALHGGAQCYLFASACHRCAWSMSTPLCQIEPSADSTVQTVNRRRSSISGRSRTVLEQASWQCHVGQFVASFSAATETHSVLAVIPRQYHVTYLNCNTHSGRSSGITI